MIGFINIIEDLRSKVAVDSISKITEHVDFNGPINTF